MHILYRILFITTGQVYYGVTSDLPRRTKQHISRAKSSNDPLYVCMRSGDTYSIDVVRAYTTRSRALLGERAHIRAARHTNVSLNLTRGGEGLKWLDVCRDTYIS